MKKHKNIDEKKLIQRLSEGDEMAFEILFYRYSDPKFVDADHGDFRVKDGSPALQLGFKNFPMNEFGVSSEKLKKIAKQPVIPILRTNQKDASGQTYNWFGATLKNIETLGEQSAAGLPEMSGVVLLEVPVVSALAKSGLKVGDVILQCQEMKIANFKQLLQVTKDSQYLGELKLVVQRNQIRQDVILKK